jgi:hypothetical protein
MAGISLDVTGWPIVVTTVEGELHEADLEVYLEDFMNRVVKQGHPFVSVVDATALTVVPNSRVRHRIGVWEVQNASLGERVNRGIAIVTQSSLVRGAMTAVNWMHPPRIPTVYEARLDVALQWARRILDEAEGGAPR